MKKIFIAAFTLLSALVSAQKLENALLWKISGNGLTQPSYLFGTMHMTCDATLDANVKKALDETTQMYLELDMDDPGMQAEMMAGMMMKDGVTMSSLVNEADLKIVDAFLQNNIGFPVKMVDNLKPFMITSMLLPKMLDCPMQTVEGELMKISTEQQEEVYGLETFAEQLAVFDAIPYKDQMDELVKTAKDGMDKDKAELKKMMDLYHQQKITELLELMDKSENNMYSQHNDVLLVKRNKNWIPKIENIAKQAPTFFGVGAAHLAGKDGVILLLRQKGYKVEAVK